MLPSARDLEQAVLQRLAAMPSAQQRLAATTSMGGTHGATLPIAGLERAMPMSRPSSLAVSLRLTQSDV